VTEPSDNPYARFFEQHRAAPKPTYAQCQEDMAVEILIGGVRKFVDIGAADGVTCSNTFLFALKGASGLSFEPTRQHFTVLKQLYAGNPRMICINEGCSDAEKQTVMQFDGLLSYIKETEDAGHSAHVARYMTDKVQEQTVALRPFSFWLARHPQFRMVDLLSVDVEGHELNVLRGIDFTQFQTRLVVIETHSTDKEGHAWLHRDYDSIDAVLKSAGYRPALKSPLNTFWISAGLYSRDTAQKCVRTLAKYGLIE